MKIKLSKEFYRRIAEMEEPEGGVFACSPEIYSQMMKDIPMMRAKMLVQSVNVNSGTDSAGNGVTISEQLRLAAVGPNRTYNEDGTGDEDNTFSRWTPCASLDITIQNPALFGKLKYGDKFYVDFTPAE